MFAPNNDWHNSCIINLNPMQITICGNDSCDSQQKQFNNNINNNKLKPIIILTKMKNHLKEFKYR